MARKIRTFLDDRRALIQYSDKDTVSGYRLLFGYLGYFMVIIGVICLLPLIALIFYPSESYTFYWFLIPGAVSIIGGLALSLLIFKKKKGQLQKLQDAVLVVAVWLVACLISSIPFILSYTTEVIDGETVKIFLYQRDGSGNSFLAAFFESISGWSTTGLTTNLDVTNSPKVLLLFRSITQFFGGVGLVLIFTSAISDKMGMRLYTAEGHSDRLMPNLIKSARLILGIYLGYIVVGTVALILCGVGPFDAINHSISAVSTGGFSTYSESLGHFNSMPGVNMLGVEIVICVLMILGGTNFLLPVLFFSRKFSSSFKHCESIVVAITLPIYCGLAFLFLWQSQNFTTDSEILSECLRYGGFYPISAMTTCGLANAPSGGLEFASGTVAFPSSVILLLTILMLMGYGVGSTSGGIKQYRIIVLLKGLWYRFTNAFVPNDVVKTRFIWKTGERVKTTDEEFHDVSTFVVLYIILFFL